jgi:hypothetical protein
VLTRHEAHVLVPEAFDDVAELAGGAAFSPSGSSVCVRSPVETMKSGSNPRPFTAATAFCSVPPASGFTAGPLKPQCVSESWTK